MEIDSKNNLSSSIFWIEVDKIKPNPFQPRKEFDQAKLKDLADSIKQYGVLQPIVVTRREVEKEDGGLTSEYELISGERRWRASKIAGVPQIPAVIRTGEQTDQMKLEMAIIENIQREDLNPVDRARAFKQLADQFSFTHQEIAKKVGKSREYVSNSMRILALPEEMLTALESGKITEGHTRPLLMLVDRPAEQMTLYKEIMLRKLTVREAEGISRRIAVERVRKPEIIDPEIIDLESRLTERLGARVSIEKRDFGNRVTIDFFSRDDLRKLLGAVGSVAEVSVQAMPAEMQPQNMVEKPIDDSTDADNPDLYSVSSFTV
ncbi:MAG: ParB/RepB/Spo0J family partition protein [Candidatus Paceibacterota bacterium]|jgi:ParB family chromosome partitioning protein